MKTNEDVNKIERSEQFQESSFGISSEGMPFVLDILRNRLYSDKILAVERELSCNAYDSHVEAGVQDKPFEITLPNRLTLNFKVRDFGNGLSPDEIKNIFVQYGSSTKRNSNDFVGLMGVGAKSPFCYGDNFIVTSFTNHRKIIYNAYIDETKVGKIAKMGEEHTDEPDGLEVCVPVRQEDIDTFVSKAIKLYSYFKVKPIIKGINPVPSFDKGVEVLASGAGWAIYGGEITSVAIMGNIAYPIDSGIFWDKLTNKQRRIIDHGIEIDFAIGEVSISASREALEYNDKTIKAIADKLNSIDKEIERNTAERVSKAKTIWEARHLWGMLPDFVKLPVKWHGVEIKSDDFLVGNGDFEVYMFNKTRRNTIKKGVCNSFEANNETKLYKMDIRSGLKPRVAYLFSQHEGLRHVVCIRPKSRKGADEFTDQTKIVVDDLPAISSVPKWVDPDRPARVYSERIKGTLFKLDEKLLGQEIDAHYRFSHSEKKISDFWIPVEEAPDDGIYVKIELFRPIFNGMRNLPDFLGHILAFRAAYGVNFEVYGVKEKGLDAISEDWQSLQEYEKEVVQDFVDKLNTPDKIEYIGGYAKFIEAILKTDVQSGPFAEFVSTLRALKENEKEINELVNAIQKASRFETGAELPNIQRIDDSNAIETLCDNYPMLKFMDPWRFNKESLPELLKYVELVDNACVNA